MCIVSTTYPWEAVTPAQLEVRRMAVPCCCSSVSLTNVISLHHSVTFVIIVGPCTHTNFSLLLLTVNSVCDWPKSLFISLSSVNALCCQDGSESWACPIPFIYILGDDLDIESQLRIQPESPRTVKDQHCMLVHHTGRNVSSHLTTLLELGWVPSGETEKRSIYGWEIASLDPNNATAICSQEQTEQNWPCTLGRRWWNTLAIMANLSVSVRYSWLVLQSQMNNLLVFTLPS